MDKQFLFQKYEKLKNEIGKKKILFINKSFFISIFRQFFINNVFVIRLISLLFNFFLFIRIFFYLILFLP